MTDQQQGISIKLAGTEYVIRMGDLNGRDVKDFRAAVGMSPAKVFANQDELDIDVIAGFVWLAKRKLNPRATYDEVLDQIDYANIEIGDANGEGDEDNPEA